MFIVNEALLDLFRGPGRCAWCKKPVKNRHPHHIFSRGAGRLDVSVNIVDLCETFSGGLNCHDAVHRGEVSREDLLAIVAQREKVNQDSIEACVHFYRRLTKGADRAAVEREIERSVLTGCDVALIWRVWDTEIDVRS